MKKEFRSKTKQNIRFILNHPCHIKALNRRIEMIQNKYKSMLDECYMQIKIMDYSKDRVQSNTIPDAGIVNMMIRIEKLQQQQLKELAPLLKERGYYQTILDLHVIIRDPFYREVYDMCFIDRAEESEIREIFGLSKSDVRSVIDDCISQIADYIIENQIIWEA